MSKSAITKTRNQAYSEVYELLEKMKDEKTDIIHLLPVNAYTDLRFKRTSEGVDIDSILSPDNITDADFAEELGNHFELNNWDVQQLSQLATDITVYITNVIYKIENPTSAVLLNEERDIKLDIDETTDELSFY